MIDAIVAGIVGGLISPLVLGWLKHIVIWRTETYLELKRRIFDEAVSALSRRAVDALDPALQDSERGSGHVVRKTEFRPETLELLERSRSQVGAFFSAEAATKFEKALSKDINLQGVPNTEFEKARIAAIRLMADELGISAPGLLGVLTSRWTGRGAKRRAPQA